MHTGTQRERYTPEGRMADDEHEYLRRVHGYIATVSTVGWPGFTMRSRASDCRGWNSASGVSAASQSNRCTHSTQFSEALRNLLQSSTNCRQRCRGTSLGG